MGRLVVYREMSFAHRLCHQSPPALRSHAFFRSIITSSQTMSLLARAPRLAARSARSNVLVQSRGMHGEYKVRLFHRDLRFPGGKFINV